MIVDHRRRLRPDPPDVRPDHAQAHLGQGDVQEDRRRQVRRGAARRHRPVPGRRVEDRRVRPVRAQPELLGQAGRPDEIVIQFFSSADTMVQALKDGEIDYARGVNADQFNALKTEPNITTVAGSANGWTSSASTPTAPAPARRSRAAARRRRPSRTRSSATRWATPSTSRQLVDQRPRRLRDVGTTQHPAGPDASWHVDPTTPRTFDIELAKQKLDRRRLRRSTRRGNAARQGRQADQPQAGLPDYDPNSPRTASSSRTGSPSSGSR